MTFRSGVLAFALALVLPLGLAAADTNTVAAPPPLTGPPLWFPVGEELVFGIKWGLVSIGRSRVTSEWVERDGKVLLAIRYRTVTGGLFNTIYPMNDSAEAIIDPATFLPLTFTFIKARRRAACHDVVTFDHGRGVARIESQCGGGTNEVAISADVRDIITFMYWMRRDGVSPGMDKTFRVMTNEGMAELRMRSAAEPETLKVPVFGKTDCVRVEPEIDLKSLLVEKGKVTLWVARDARGIAPRLSVKAPLAKVQATLCHVGGPGDDRWSAKSRKGGGEASCDPVEE